MATSSREYERTHPWISFELDVRRFPWEFWLLLGEAVSKFEHLAGVPLRPNIAMKMHTVYLIKGVQGTTAIEGNTLTEEQIERHLDGTLELPPSKEYLKKEVDNVLRALETSWQKLNGVKLTAQTVQDFNAAVLDGLTLEDGVVPGEVRRYPVGVLRYRGAPATDCEYLLSRLMGWLDEIQAAFPPHANLAVAVIQAVMAHLYIAWIHPFGDGNGRTARLLEYTLLMRAGVPSPATHLLSNHYNQTRAEYYRQLNLASKSGGDVVPFMMYAVQGLVDGLREQISDVREQQLDVAWRNFVHEEFKRKPGPSMARCRDLVLDLSKRSGDRWTAKKDITRLTPRVAEAYAGKTAKTLTRDINTLEKMGLIETEPGKIRAKTERIRAFLPTRSSSATVTEAEGV